MIQMRIYNRLHTTTSEGFGGRIPTMKGLLQVVLLFLSVAHIRSWNDGSVLLRDVQVLTLYKGKYTTARRSSPVPQLQCVRGSAGCGSFIPEVVQCTNKGWDGVDAQWECKTDMDNAYKFGRIEVSCEGFNHPDDAYILKGSNNRQQSSTGEGDSSGLLVVALLLFLAYGVYKLFLSGPTNLGQNEQFPDNGSNTHNPNGPPPPGFKPDFTGASGFPGSAGGYAGSAGYGANPGYGFRSDYSGQQQQQHFAGAGAHARRRTQTPTQTTLRPGHHRPQPLAPEHALLQALEGPREDRWAGGHWQLSMMSEEQQVMSSGIWDKHR
ncbi:unnamed protein product [Coregonus sp. 'balchen']|nr:unnamed protein product [Coregonus sp. 'balchen']